eukprot:13999965-Ditylum_brightwellii.AAC.1
MSDPLQWTPQLIEDNSAMMESSMITDVQVLYCAFENQRSSISLILAPKKGNLKKLAGHGIHAPVFKE